MSGKTQRRDRPQAMAAIITHVETQLIHKKRGGIAWLADRLGLTKQALSRWSAVPLDRVSAVSQITGIPPHEIRPDKPDIWPVVQTKKRRKDRATAA